jgi:6-pyruvoyltetrahydropterin/6-carboxytetrahydropterin synthase
MLGMAITGHTKSDPAELAPDNSAPAAHRIAVEHTFETAHRLPHMEGKCVSLHGHSWRVIVSVIASHLTNDCTVVEFGALKAVVRHWIDDYLDHSTMLGVGDPLVEPLVAAGCKVFRFGAEDAAITKEAETLATDLAWPTVEAVAVLLWRMSTSILAALPTATGARVGSVMVRETDSNTAVYDRRENS